MTILKILGKIFNLIKSGRVIYPYVIIAIILIFGFFKTWDYIAYNNPNVKKDIEQRDRINDALGNINKDLMDRNDSLYRQTKLDSIIISKSQKVMLSLRNDLNSINDKGCWRYNNYYGLFSNKVVRIDSVFVVPCKSKL